MPKFLQNPSPVFVCDWCGWRKIASVRYRLVRHEARKDYDVEVLADPYWYEQIHKLVNVGSNAHCVRFHHSLRLPARFFCCHVTMTPMAARPPTTSVTHAHVWLS